MRAPDWRPGGAPHLATKILPEVPPYVSLVIIFGPVASHYVPLTPPTPTPLPTFNTDVCGGVRTFQSVW